MKKKLYVVVMIAGLMLGGCGKDEKQAEAPAPVTMPAVEQDMNKVAETAGSVTDEAKELAGAVKEPVEKKLEQPGPATVPEKMDETAVQEQEIASPVVAESGQAAVGGKEVADKLTTTVERVVLDNKNGKIILLHKKHAEAHGCAACHGDQVPGPFKLGKDAGHALCQGCHKQKQAGPTSCTKCHEKKAKAPEGC